ncbi:MULTISPECIES: phage tail protein [Phaeobacter]|uniref:phage tail protein n=1 Tax=Phaeobacter TaxID=302485 RepID=UPI000590E30E|nr:MULTISPECIES: phage tail protein [Phaeobacter]AUQ89414.1 phage-related tail protein (gpU) [Phaeobacter inhibens]KII12575.1 oxidoreductase [Phaeobacter sp. S60]
MAGPVTMALGPFAFRAHGFGYTDVGRKLDTSWAEIETAGRLNALQWTGPRNETVSINGVLFPQEFGGATTLEGVRLAAKSGIPLVLVSLGGRVFGSHAIQKVDEDRSYHDRNGTPGRNAYSIELKRVGAGFSLLSLLGVI